LNAGVRVKRSLNAKPFAKRKELVGSICAMKSAVSIEPLQFWKIIPASLIALNYSIVKSISVDNHAI